jgi:hypothetical protein
MLLIVRATWEQESEKETEWEKEGDKGERKRMGA